MSNFDPSRLHDLQLIDDRLRDPATTRRGKGYLERSKAAILRQERTPQIKQLRARLLKATQANDAEAVNKLQEQLQKLDQQQGYDQHESSIPRGTYIL